jgi:nucleoside-diphosphate-sugar epimerase
MRRICLALPTNRPCAAAITALGAEAAYAAERFGVEVRLLILDSCPAAVRAGHADALRRLPPHPGIVAHHLDEDRQQGGVTFHRYDIASEEIGDVFERVRPEVVFHLAAQPSVPVSVSDPVLDAQVNVIGLLRVLDACVAADVQKVVFASSGGTIYGPQEDLPVPETARGRPASPYGITKRCAEDYLRFYSEEFGLVFTSLALANVYGPRQDPHGESGVVAGHRPLRRRGTVPVDPAGRAARSADRHPRTPRWPPRGSIRRR